MHNKGLERSLKELEIRCTYFKIGCQWTGELGSLGSHLRLNSAPQNRLKGCKFVNVECSHGCGQQFQRQLLAKHLEVCPERPYSCTYCRKYDSSFDDVTNNHWPKCKCYPLSCPNHCTPHAIERQYFQDHLNKDCPLAIVNCDFHYAGCEVQLPRKDMPAHLAENIAHLSLLSDMNLKLTKKLLQKDTEIEQLSCGLQEMTVQLCELTEEQKRFRMFVEQEIVELKRQAVYKAKGEVQDKTTEIAALKKKIASLRKSLEKTASKKELTSTLRREIDQASKKQEGDITHLAQDIAQLKKKQEQDTRELREKQAHERQLQKKLEQDEIEHRRQASSLQRLHTHGTIPTEVVMPNFELHRITADTWLSNPFYTHPGGYKMRLRVDANGSSSGRGTHVSLYAVLMRGEFDQHLKWPLLCAITVQILNQVEDRDHYEQILLFRITDHSAPARVTEGETSKQAWGRNHFISHALLYNRTTPAKYLKDDCIHLRVAKFEVEQ